MRVHACLVGWLIGSEPGRLLIYNTWGLQWLYKFDSSIMFLWFSYGLPINSYGFPMDFLWVFPMAFPCFLAFRPVIPGRSPSADRRGTGQVACGPQLSEVKISVIYMMTWYIHYYVYIICIYILCIYNIYIYVLCIYIYIYCVYITYNIHTLLCI